MEIFSTGVFLEAKEVIINGEKSLRWVATGFEDDSYMGGVYVSPVVTADTVSLMIKDTVKVVAKKYVDNDGGEYVELFFPEFEVNSGMIMAWDSVGGHGEACIEYYNEGVQIPLPKDLQIMYEKNYDCELMELES